jgi:septal ring factor EnvC (AmiA/AmiB activator)
MIALPVPVRRALVVAGVVTSLVLGLATIRAAAAWTAASAPLDVAPVAATSLQDRLAAEQARSADLEARLTQLTDQAAQLTTALGTARAQATTDAQHAADLQAKLESSQARLRQLDQQVAQAQAALKAQIAAAQAAARRATTAPVAPAPAATEPAEHGDD